MSDEMTIRVEVTAEDIAKGKIADCKKRPAALAINRATGRDDASVGISDVSFPTQSAIAFLLPGKVQDFICDFDMEDPSLPAQPISFDLTLPAELVKTKGSNKCSPG